MLPGVRPSIFFAAVPTASMPFLAFMVSFCTATTDGSFKTIPLFLIKIKVLAVPRSIARSLDRYLEKKRNMRMS